MTRTIAIKIVRTPLVADLYDSLLEKYMGVVYSTRDMRLKKLRARL